MRLLSRAFPLGRLLKPNLAKKMDRFADLKLLRQFQAVFYYPESQKMILRWRNVFVLVLWLISAQVDAEQPDTIRLWPGPAPESLGDGKNAQPTIQRFSPAEENQTGAAIVILPGGAYGHLAMGHEGRQIAEWLTKAGVHAFICDYRHRGKGYGHPAPMFDAQRAIRTVRANAKQFGIAPNKIGVMGFSAGGHLASTICTHYDAGDADSDDIIEQQSSRPDFAILCYPVIAMGTPFTHKGSQRNLFGKNAPKETLQKFSNHQQVTKNTPPTFLWHCSDDKVALPRNSIVYFQALIASGVPAEIHIYEKGGHGIGLAAEKPGVQNWGTACVDWMARRNLLGSK